MPSNSTFEVEGVTIDLSQVSVRAAIVSALSFVPMVGSVLSAIAAVVPIRGRTQHIGVTEGYEYARKFANDFVSQIERALPNDNLRIAYTRWVTKRLYTRYRQRWPSGLALSELERMRLIGITAQQNEIYTIYYLASYYFFRNADAEHLREEFERDFTAHIVEDYREFVNQLRAGEIEDVGQTEKSSTGLLIAAAIPVSLILKKFLWR